MKKRKKNPGVGLLLGLAAIAAVGYGVYVYSEWEEYGKDKGKPTPKMVAAHLVNLVEKEMVAMTDQVCEFANLSAQECAQTRADFKKQWAEGKAELVPIFEDALKDIDKAAFDAGAPCIMAAQTGEAVQKCPLSKKIAEVLEAAMADMVDTSDAQWSVEDDDSPVSASRVQRSVTELLFDLGTAGA